MTPGRNFIWDQPAVRVVFGSGCIDRLGDEITRLGVQRPIVFSTAGRAATVRSILDRLPGLDVMLHAEAVMHVPVEIAERARAATAAHRADCLIAIGGGSTIGLAKAVALQTGQPILAVPTTYSGSEMTAIYGLTEGGTKRTGRDARVRPKTVFYDPSLTLGLPAAVSATSGMNAMAHCVEALYAPDANPISAMMATEGLAALARSLPAVIRDVRNLDARTDAMYGAWLGGSTLATTTVGIHHKLCHVLGGTFNLPHAEVHTVILPHATAFNRDAAPDAMEQIAGALGTNDAAAGLFDLAVRLGAPTSLRQIGMPRDGLDRAAKLATESPYANPRPVTCDAVRHLLEQAYEGARPA
jgi:alcohol dehydrogenase class IV